MKKDWYSLQELCEQLSITTATGQNWIKTGKIQFDSASGGKEGFSGETVRQIQKDLQSGKNTRLRSRRNKSYIQGKETYRNYLPDTSANLAQVKEVIDWFQKGTGRKGDMLILLADCALQLLRLAKKTKDIGDSMELVEALVPVNEIVLSEAPKVEYVLEPEVDVLGFLYLSLRHAGEKKASGAYYTPTAVVRKTIQGLKATGWMDEKKTFLDPCCGSGNFLIQFPTEVNPKNIYGSDIDEISVKLTRINLAVKYPKVPAEVWKEHIKCQNFLIEEKQEYDCILGNPPWGYDFSEKEQRELKKHYQTAAARKTESYDVFLEQALRRVKENGTVTFILPEAVLHVRSHEKIRELLLQETDIEELDYLGEVFYRVQCPSVILRLRKTGKPMQTKGMKVELKGERFEIAQERRIEKTAFYFQVRDEEYRLLQKLRQECKAQYLKGNADFVLGIVTGDNQRYVTAERKPGAEVVLKGADITKYGIRKPERYLVYQPEKFQQTAREAYYRNRDKLLYRFIGERLVFARDREGCLSLNSCNILIPHLEGVSTEYLLAVFNSRVAQFVFQKQFHSVKVLRSHLEEIPIPAASKRQQAEIGELVKKIENSTDEKQWNSLYEQIDLKIARLAGLTKAEYQMIIQKP